MRTPASKAEYPCTVCRNWASRKIDPKMPKFMISETPLVALKARLRNRRSGSIGAGARRSQATNAPEQRDAEPRAAPSDLRREPALVVAAHDAPDEREEAGAREHEPAHVERAVRAVALVEHAVGERREHDADRDVEEEDPLPREPVDDRAADDRPERDGEAAQARPDADREAAAVRPGTRPPAASG